MKYLIILLLFPACLAAQTDSGFQKSRLIVLADMGNEPDEVQQIVHMMMYSNEFDIEGLIAVTGKFLNPQQKMPYRKILHPDLFHEVINGYEKVVPNLQIHASGWPEAEYLRSIVVSGQSGYGIDDIGEGKFTEGSNLIKRSLLSNDPRLLYIVVNAGSNTLAQALFDIEQELTDNELNSVLQKIRVFENGAQDNAGAWICARFPEIFWIRSNYQTYSYGGPSWESSTQNHEDEETKLGPHTWEPFDYSAMGQHHWALANIIADHGPLGMVYPLRQTHFGKIIFIEGGGTIPWLGLIHGGLWDVSRPDWGGWSGRYSKEKVKNPWSKHQSVKVDEEKYGDFYCYVDVSDNWIDPITSIEYNNIYTPVWRWRRAYFNDFKCRMDWCIEKYENANHHPVASVNGINDEIVHDFTVAAGETITFDASGSSDPDGDSLSFSWWIYTEAGTYEKPIDLNDQSQSIISFEIPKDAAGDEIHLILEIMDRNKIAPLSDYRRIVLHVK